MKYTRTCLTAFAFALISLSFTPAADAQTCTETGFIRDGINLTAALINPVTVTSPVNAAGCHIGIYYDSGTAILDGADIYGASYFGVAVNADAAPVVVQFTRNLIHNIGEVPFNGTQHGIGIYVRAFFASEVTGFITDNIVTAYQKGGIVVNGRVRLSRLSNNEVHGLGHVDFIAQNGIQIGYGAMPYPGEVLSNRISGNSYIGTPGDGSSAAGILIVGGPGYGVCPDGNDCPYTTTAVIGINAGFTQLGRNFLFNNDVGVYSSNIDALGNAPATPTFVLMVGSIASSDRCFNPYQAGISAVGNNDVIVANYILQGGGYGPECGMGIDLTGSINPVVNGNNVEPAPGPDATRARMARIKVVPVK
jgi:hypothetical protein